MLTWDVTIDPGAQKAIEYTYRVTYPKGKEISYEEEYGLGPKRDDDFFYRGYSGENTSRVKN